MIATHVGASDVVITTAAVPGRRAPVLVSAAMVSRMRPGSVIVDLAAATGGNCELTEDGQEVTVGGRPHNRGRRAGFVYAHACKQPLCAQRQLFCEAPRSDGRLAPDFADEILDKSAVTISGVVHHEPTLAALEEAKL